MKTTTLFNLLAAVALAAPVYAQTDSNSPTTSAATGGAPSADEMKMMMELAKTNENHKLLASTAGNWSYVVKMWMDGDTSKKAQESKGTATRKSIMDGRYVAMEVNGNMQMPDEKGKMQNMAFKGMGTDGYDNVKKKFVSTWFDSMGTGIMMSEGDYDASSKTFTYKGEFEMMPGMKMKVREVLKMTDKDHMMMEWYEDRGGKEMKTMEIDYTRTK